MTNKYIKLVIITKKYGYFESKYQYIKRGGDLNT